MDTDRITGGAKQVAGKAENVIGKAFGDQSTAASGRATEAEGIIENAVGQAKDVARSAINLTSETVHDRPGSSMLVAGLIGLVVGYTLAKGSQPARPRRYWDRYS
jgi:uncharacterized protein YjbJ (UPF0337 family)